MGITFDGTTSGSPMATATTKLRASDGRELSTFPVGTAPGDVAFDGTNVRVRQQPQRHRHKANSSTSRKLHCGRRPTTPSLRRISYLGVYWRKSHHPVLEGYVAQQFRVVFLHQFRLSRTPNRSRFEEPARRECIKKSVLKKKVALTSPAGVRKRRANETGF
jgi:hypothetical protein